MGVRAYLGSLFAFLVLKSDILLVKYLRGASETGYYAIAVGLADILMMLPTRGRHGAVPAARGGPGPGGQVGARPPRARLDGAGDAAGARASRSCSRGR